MQTPGCHIRTGFMPAQRLVLSSRDHASFSTPCHSDTTLAARARSVLLPKMPVASGVRRHRSSVSLECAISAPERHTQQHQTHSTCSHTPPRLISVDEPSPHSQQQHPGSARPQRSVGQASAHPPLPLGEMGFRADFNSQYSLLEVLGKVGVAGSRRLPLGGWWQLRHAHN